MRVLDYRLVLLVAPGESGKTHCIKSWAAQCEEESQWVIAWLNIREEDNSPAVFLKDLENALGQIVEADSISAVQAGDLEAGMTGLINRLAGSQQHLAIILDNYQAISSAPIHAAVQLLLDYLPPQAHVIIASRSEPPLALPRLRVRRQLLELGPEDLCCV
jgi:LuxR family maltose regulon positive regulatory protein